MAQKPVPTDAELALLKVLWEYGPSTVSQVHSLLRENPARGYTTILKLLQIMAQKGLVKRDRRGRAHVYSAVVSSKQVHHNLVKHLLTRAFDNSTSKLVAQALATRPISPKELAEIRLMLNEIEESAK